MFNLGEKIVCIEESGIGNFSVGSLTLYQTYTVKYIITSTMKGYLDYSVVLEGIENKGFNKSHFVGLTQFRRNKILKLKEKICSNPEIE